MTISSVRRDHNPEPDQHLVLLVEDEVLIRFVIAEELRERGYRVIEAASGDEAVEMLRAGVPVNLVFSDVRMPGATDGLGLLSFIRASDDAIAVIITSGHLDPVEALTRGANAFLPKPYGIDDVVGCLEKHIDYEPEERQWPRTMHNRR